MVERRTRVRVGGESTSDGTGHPDEVVDDPSEEFLATGVRDVASGLVPFLVVEALDDPSGQTFIQLAASEPGTLTIEHNPGSADRLFEAATDDQRLVLEILTSWRAGSAGWETALPWRRMVVEPPPERKRRWFGR